MERLQRAVRYVPQWRQISMGDDSPELIQRVFGTLPSPEPPRHGETLDV